jgi:CheY-like chemotaxis protein
MSKPKKILIVDDELDILTYFEAIFQDSGYDTVLAQDGVEGFELAESEKPDLIALDITMPGQSGIRTYRQYKQHPALKDVPVIIITAVNDSFKKILNDIDGLVTPEAFFNKPIDPAELLRVVEELLAEKD